MFVISKAQNAVTTQAGSTQGFMDATGSSAKFKAPTGICISPDGQFLYVADYSGHRIRKINVSTKAVTTVAGNGVSGYNDSTGSAAQFSYPSGVCINSTGTFLYICDNGNGRIRKVQLSNSRVTTVAGNGSFSYSDNANGLLASFNGPTDVIIANDTALYVSDTENQLIRKINLQTTEVTTIAGMLNVGGFQNGVGANAAFRLPRGLAISNNKGTLYIADTGNNMIRAIDLSDNNVTTVAGDGVQGYLDNANAQNARFNSPNGVAVVPGDANTLFVADNANHRIRKIDLSNSSVSTIAGNGAVPPASTYADNTNGLNAKFFYPTNLIVSPDAKDIYVADQGNFRVRRVKTDLVIVSYEMINSAGKDLKLYPNPAREELVIEGNDISRVEIISTSGQLIKHFVNVDTQSKQILDLSDLPSGFYVLNAYRAGGVEYRKFLVTK